MARRNADDRDGRYEVIAAFIEVNDKTYVKGEFLDLPKSVARGLLGDGGIKDHTPEVEE